MKLTKRRKKRLKQWLIYAAIVVFGVYSFGQMYKMTDAHFTSISTSQKQNFINSMAPKAKKIHDEYGILPSINIAQAILESDFGTSDLSTESNNYYGIKQGAVSEVYATQEYYDEDPITVNASFAVYDSMEESMEAYALLLVNGTSWNSELYAGVINASHYSEAAYALQEAGYATDPNYAEKLIQVIENYDLYIYDE